MENDNNGPQLMTTTGKKQLEAKEVEEEEEKPKVTLLYQMERKYFCQDDEEQQQAQSGAALIINMFGSSPCKAAHEHLLELLVLDNLGISRIGCLERLSSMAKKVVELDLSYNQLGWPSVGQLFLALPQLRTLNLSQNPDLGKKLDEALPKAAKLRTLILNGLCMPLSNLHHIFLSASALRELHLSRGKFQPDDFAVFQQHFPTPISSSLDVLHLNDCGLKEWCNVLAILRLFPQLQSLFVADNPLKSIQRECQECDDETAPLTSRMRAITFSNCRINSWESIENLESIGGGQLEELRVPHIPLLEDYSMEERTHLVIGRLRSLKILNGSAIDARQREDSERFFIRYYANAEKKPLIYDQLVAEHGILEQLVKVDLTPKKYAKVSIHCDETDWVRMWIRLRLSGTVQELMRFIEGLTKIPFRLMRIFYVEQNGPGPSWPTELRFPNQQLKMLHIEDGDEFFVQTKMVSIPQTAKKAISSSNNKQQTITAEHNNKNSSS